MNLDLDAAVMKRRIQIRELEEMRLKAYENASIYKESIKRWYGKRSLKRKMRFLEHSFSDYLIGRIGRLRIHPISHSLAPTQQVMVSPKSVELK
jgi:hypothetical protein